jgi:hypothetical protein
VHQVRRQLLVERILLNRGLNIVLDNNAPFLAFVISHFRDKSWPVSRFSPALPDVSFKLNLIHKFDNHSAPSPRNIDKFAHHRL